MLCTIMRSILRELDGRDFRNFMEAFLRFADHSWGKAYNLVWSIGMLLLQIFAINGIQMVTTWAAFALFIVALIAL